MANLAVLRTLRGEIPSLEAILHQKVKLRSEFHVLKTTPGIGDALAATIMLETGGITRFPGVGHFSCYCRCVESERISNGKKRVEGNANRPGLARLAVCNGLRGGNVACRKRCFLLGPATRARR